MARPRKEGFEYFSHDTSSMSDEKLDLLVMQYGGNGYAFYFLHLEYIYKSDDLSVDVSGPVFRNLICAKLKITPEEYDEILHAAVEYGLFDEERFNDGKLFSNGVKKRVEAIEEERENARERKQKSRERARDNAEATEFSQAVTEFSQPVTDCHEPSHNVTPKKEKEKEKESIKDSPPSPPRGGGERDEPDDEEPEPKRNGTPNCPHEQIIALYHELLPQCPRVKSWNGHGRKQLALRWREDKARQSIDWWRDIFGKVAQSDFLMGRKPNTTFLFSLGWFVGPQNFEKVLNDHYANHAIPECGGNVKTIGGLSF